MAVTEPFEFDDEWANATDWVRMYRKVGLQVVPAHLPSEGGQWKRPFGDWLEFQDTPIPESQIARWYDPQAGEHRLRRNMGAITGRASGGVFVIDLDAKPGSIARHWWGSLMITQYYNGMAADPDAAHRRRRPADFLPGARGLDPADLQDPDRHRHPGAGRLRDAAAVDARQRQGLHDWGARAAAVGSRFHARPGLPG